MKESALAISTQLNDRVGASCATAGLGELLIQAAEQLEAKCGKSLLVLETVSDEAARIYA